MDTFTERFRWLLATAELRQAEVARLTTLSPKAVEFLSAGRRSNPTRETTVKIATAFRVSVGWLLTGEGRAPTAAQVRAAVARARLGRDPNEVARTANDTPGVPAAVTTPEARVAAPAQGDALPRAVGQ